MNDQDMRIGGTLMCLLCFVCCSGFNISTTTTSIPGCDPQCHDEACLVCRDNGTGTVPLEALKATFNTGSPIDLILMVDTSVHRQFDDVKVFITSMMKQLSLSFNFMIHPDQVRVAVLKINSIGTTVWFDGISSREKAITYCQINDIISTLQVDTNSTNKKLFNGLTFYNQEFLRKTPTRPDASKVLWIFSDANGLVDQNSLFDVETSAQDIKQGSVLFTTAFDKCPWGWFNNLAKETAMRNIASNASYYACYDMWLKVKTLMILGKPYRTSYLVEVNNGSSLCTCDVSTGYYKCDTITTDHTVAIAAGTVGGIAGVIVAIVIIVVAVKCSKKRNATPANPQHIPDNRGPRLPRVSTINTDIQRLPGEGADAPPMPLPPKARNRARVEGGSNARTNEPAEYMNAQNVPGALSPEPHTYNNGYQILRNSGEQQNMIDGWSEYLTASREYFELSHLAVHSTRNNNNPESFARTRGFKMVAGELATIERTMIEGSTGVKVRVARQVYRVESATAVQLQGIRTVTRRLSCRQETVRDMLCVVKNEQFLVIGICPRDNNDHFPCLQVILDHASLV